MKDDASSKKIVPWIVAIALFMETLDITIINTAVPKMALSLFIDPIELKFALTSYLLSLALFIPLSGWVADKWGSQRTFLFALVLFTLSSVACGRSTSLTELVVSRAFQGVGGAFMMPVGRLIILRLFMKSELVRAMNFVSLPALLGPLLGPLVGGFITTYYSWPWIFYVNIPIGLLGLIFTLRYIDNYKIEDLRPFDGRGFLLFGLSLSALFFAFESISMPFISTFLSLFIFVIACVGFLFFYQFYKKTPYPLLNLKLFSIRTFCVASLGNIWMRLGLGSVSFLLPLLLQLGYGVSPLESGLLTCGWTLGMVSSKLINKKLLSYWGFRKMLAITSVLTGVAIVSFSLINAVNIPLILGLVFISGMIASLQYTVMSVLYYVDIPQETMSHATSIAGTLQQFSMGIGITLSALILQFFIGWKQLIHLGNPFPFRYTFLVMGGIVSLGIFIFLRLNPRDGQEVV